MTTGTHRAVGVPPRVRVLLADDEPGLLTTTAAILGDLYDVTTASSGEEAVALLLATPFDVVCTDYAMGGKLTGLDVIAHARTLSHYVGKILVTGQNEIGGGAGYYVLSKPCDPQRLLDVVERAASSAAAHRRVSGATSEAKRLSGELTGPLPDKRPSRRLPAVQPAGGGVERAENGGPPKVRG